jgi:BMFP domain-containing protein YqiC|tara:strand:+ start:5016 stop:5258 length:243 start_codon:yes stop_codon:yes gene_type:complete
MNKKEFLSLLSDVIKNGVLTTQDLKKEVFTNMQFQKNSLINKFQLVSKEEFNILKKIVQKQQKQIENLLKKKKIKKAKKP